MSLNEYLGKPLSAEHLDGVIGSEFSIGQIEGMDSIQAVMDRDSFEGLGEIESLEAAIMQFRPIMATAPAKVLAQEVSAPQSRMEPPIPASHPLRNQMMAQRADESTERMNVMARKAAAKVAGNDLLDDSRIQAAANQMNAPKNWLDRAMQTAAKVKGTSFSAAAIAPATEVAHPAFVRKAKEIQQGGFIGGEVGNKAKQVVAQLKGRVAKVKKLVAQGKNASQNVKAGIESQTKKELANIIVDRARIERFRLASVTKLYSLHKQALAKKDLSKASSAGAASRAKLVASAEQNMKLAKMAGESFKSMMTKPLQIPGMSDVLQKLNAGTTDQQSLRRIGNIPKMFNTVSPPRSMVGSSTVKAPQSDIPGVVRTSWHVKPALAAAIASRAFGDFGDFGYSFSEGWNDLTGAVESVVDAATSDTARGIASVTGQVAEITGTVLVATGVGAEVGTILIASGAGLTALAKVGVSEVKTGTAATSSQLKSEISLTQKTTTSQKRSNSVFFSLRVYTKPTPTFGIELIENPQQAGMVFVKITRNGPNISKGGKGKTTNGVKDAVFLEFELPFMKGVQKYAILNNDGNIALVVDVPQIASRGKGLSTQEERLMAKDGGLESRMKALMAQQAAQQVPVEESSFFEQHWMKLAIGAGVLVVGGIAAKKFKVFGELSPMEQAEQMAADDDGLEGTSCGCNGGLGGLTPQQAKFKHASTSCKGRPGYRSCMSRQLKGR